MWTYKDKADVLFSPVEQKISVFRSRFRSARDRPKRAAKNLLDALVERHVKYCH